MLSLLTYGTVECAPYFADREFLTVICTQFLRAAAENRCEILIYAFEPHRVHLLIGGAGPDADWAGFVSRSRCYSARAFRDRTGLRLWGMYAREVIWCDERSADALARRLMSLPQSGSFAWDRLSNLQSQITDP